MAVTLRASSTAGYSSAAATFSVSTPASTVATDMCVMVVHLKQYDQTLAADPPAGWTSEGSGTNGSVTTGVDVGSVKTWLFTRTGVTGAVATTVATPGSIGTVGLLGAQIFVFQKGASDTWAALAAVFGGDTSNGTNFSATASGGLAVQAGDLVVACAGINSDAGPPTAIAIGGMAGATLSQTAITDGGAGTTTGGDGRTIAHSAAVTAGSSSAAPTLTYTNANAQSGTVGWLRLRVVAGPASGSSTGGLSFFGYAGGPPLRNFFDGGADGVTVTTANSDDGTGKPITVTLTSIGLTYETDRALIGPSCAKVSDAAGTGGAPNGSTAVLIYGNVAWSVLQAAAEVWVYIPTGSTWSSAGDVLAIRNGTGNVAKVQINASRVAFVSDATGAVSGGSAPTAIPFDTWYRIALWCKVGETTATGQIQARVGAAFDAPSWTMTPSTTSNTGTTPITNARGGKLTTTHTPPIFYLGGFNAGPGHTTFIADPVLPKTGSATGAVAWAGSGSGKRTPKGSSTTGAVAWVGSASGDAPPNRGSAAGAVAWVGAGSGSRPAVPPKTGSAAGAISWAGSASGRKATRGDAVGAFTFTGTGSGKRAPKASSSGAFTFAGTASGRRPSSHPRAAAPRDRSRGLEPLPAAASPAALPPGSSPGPGPRPATPHRTGAAARARSHSPARPPAAGHRKAPPTAP